MRGKFPKLRRAFEEVHAEREAVVTPAAHTDTPVNAVRAGAHFYMAHKLREYPHPADPEITMGEHVRDGCPGCEAEAALDALADRSAVSEKELSAAQSKIDALEAEHSRLQTEHTTLRDAAVVFLRAYYGDEGTGYAAHKLAAALWGGRPAE